MRQVQIRTSLRAGHQRKGNSKPQNARRTLVSPAQVLLGTHPRMQDSDNPNRFVDDAIIDDVLTNATIAKSGCNFLSVWSQFGIHREITDGFRNSHRAALLLPLSPGGEQVVEERLKIGFRFCRELDLMG